MTMRLSKRVNHGAPKRTLAEMAAEFGVTRQKLACDLKRDTSAPQPVLRSASDGHSACWYEPAPLRRWWKERATKGQACAQTQST